MEKTSCGNFFCLFMKKILKIRKMVPNLCGCVQVKTEEPAGIHGKTMEISFIIIGKGDAFLLKMPEGRYYMYDTGKKEDFEQIQKVLEQKKVTSLKGIFYHMGTKTMQEI